MKIKLMKLSSAATIPTRGSEQAAGFDLYACIDEGSVEISPGQTQLIGTGFAAAIPDGYFGAVFARSGLATKMGLRPANCVGVIDSDYRGEFKVPIHNDSSQTRTVAHGDRIAQLIILPYPSCEFEECDSLDETARGEGGFGHTGNR